MVWRVFAQRKASLARAHYCAPCRINLWLHWHVQVKGLLISRVCARACMSVRKRNLVILRKSRRLLGQAARVPSVPVKPNHFKPATKPHNYCSHHCGHIVLKWQKAAIAQSLLRHTNTTNRAAFNLHLQCFFLNIFFYCSSFVFCRIWVPNVQNCCLLIGYSV